MRDTVVFLGPTLAREDAERILDADYLPPICRGDLAKLPEHVRYVGIVDGEFYQSLSVSPKEVLKLLRRGVTVFGSSSMGALRAAETWKLGMIGVGKIFAMYRDGILDADDEVALDLRTRNLPKALRAARKSSRRPGHGCFSGHHRRSKKRPT